MKVELHSPEDEESPLEKVEFEGLELDGKEELPDQDDMVPDRWINIFLSAFSHFFVVDYLLSLKSPAFSLLILLFIARYLFIFLKDAFKSN